MILHRIPACRRSFLVALVAISTITGVACEKTELRTPVFPVRGKVLFRGQVPANALVIFHPTVNANPTAPRPTGRVNANGNFTLTTFAENDGAPAGDYNVTIIWSVQKEGNDDYDDGANMVDLLQGYYSSPKTSGIRRQVKEGENELEPILLDG
jgi:hypothetical protein